MIKAMFDRVLRTSSAWGDFYSLHLFIGFISVI